jgi:hypothetical protein
MAEEEEKCGKRENREREGVVFCRQFNCLKIAQFVVVRHQTRLRFIHSSSPFPVSFYFVGELEPRDLLFHFSPLLQTKLEPQLAPLPLQLRRLRKQTVKNAQSSVKNLVNIKKDIEETTLRIQGPV